MMNQKKYIRMARVNLKSRKRKTGFQVAFMTVGLLVMILVNLGVGFIYNMNDVMYQVSQKGLMIHVSRVLDEGKEDYLYNMLLEKQEQDERISYVERRMDEVGMHIQSLGEDEVSWIYDEAIVNLTNMRNYVEDYMTGEMELSDNEIILPKYIFRTDSDAMDVYGELEYIDCEPYIGRKVKIEVDTTVYTVTSSMKRGKQSYEFKIAGVYDNVKQCTSGNEAYITGGMLEKIKGESEEFAQGVDRSVFGTPAEQVVIIVKDHKYVDEMVEELKEMNIGIVKPQLIDENNEVDKLLQFIMISGDAIGLLIIMWASISMVLSYLKDIRNRTSEYGLLKAVGYKERDLSRILGMETIIIGSRAILISVVLGEILVLVLNQLIQEKGNILWKYLRAGYTWWQLLLVVAVGLLAPSAAYFFGIRKIREINPINALKSGE